MFDSSIHVRLLPQQNPLCQRMSCDHPLKGGRREGHFDMGMGPCKAPGCTCGSFQFGDPALLLDMRREGLAARSAPLRGDLPALGGDPSFGASLAGDRRAVSFSSSPTPDGDRPNTGA